MHLLLNHLYAIFMTLPLLSVAELGVKRNSLSSIRNHYRRDGRVLTGQAYLLATFVAVPGPHQPRKAPATFATTMLLILIH